MIGHKEGKALKPPIEGQERGADIMEYVYASLLLHYAKRPITEDGLKKILEAAGVAVDDVRVKAIVAALSNVNIDEAIKSAGFSVSTVAVTAQPVQPAAQPAAEAKKEEKREEEKKESEEEVAEGLAALFG